MSNVYADNTRARLPKPTDNEAYHQYLSETIFQEPIADAELAILSDKIEFNAIFHSEEYILRRYAKSDLGQSNHRGMYRAITPETCHITHEIIVERLIAGFKGWVKANRGKSIQYELQECEDLHWRRLSHELGRRKIQGENPLVVTYWEGRLLYIFLKRSVDIYDVRIRFLSRDDLFEVLTFYIHAKKEWEKFWDRRSKEANKDPLRKIDIPRIFMPKSGGERNKETIEHLEKWIKAQERQRQELRESLATEFGDITGDFDERVVPLHFAMQETQRLEGERQRAYEELIFKGKPAAKGRMTKWLRSWAFKPMSDDARVFINTAIHGCCDKYSWQLHFHESAKDKSGTPCSITIKEKSKKNGKRFNIRSSSEKKTVKQNQKPKQPNLSQAELLPLLSVK